MTNSQSSGGVKDYRGPRLLDLNKNLTIEDVRQAAQRQDLIRAGTNETGVGKTLISKTTPEIKLPKPPKADRAKNSIRGIIDDEIVNNGTVDEIVEAAIAEGIQRADRNYLSKEDIDNTLLAKSPTGRSLMKGLDVATQMGEGVISGGQQTIGGALSLFGYKNNIFKKSTTQNKLKILRQYIEQNAPERVQEFDRKLVMQGYSKGAETTGRTMETLAESGLIAAKTYQAVRAIPYVQKLAKAGRGGKIIKFALENAAAELSIRTTQGIKNEQTANEVARLTASSPSILFAFANAPMLAVGVGADLLAGKAMGISNEDNLINAAANLGGNVMDYFGLRDAVKKQDVEAAVRTFKKHFKGPKALGEAAGTEMKQIYAYAQASPNDPKGVIKMWGEAENRLTQLHKKLEAETPVKEKRLIHKTGPTEPPETPETKVTKAKADVEKLDYEIEAQKQQVEALGPDLTRLANKRTGELPEVTGKGKSLFARKGDDIADVLGFEDSETLRRTFEQQRVAKEKLSLLRRERAEANKLLKEAKAKTRSAKDKAILKRLKKMGEWEPLDTPKKHKDTPLSEQSKEMRQRKLLKTMQDSKKTTKQLKKTAREISPQEYQVVHNKETMTWAEDFVKNDIDGARKAALGKDEINESSAALGLALMKHYQERGEWTLVKELLDTMDKKARDAGRYIQPFAMYGHLTPEGMVKVGKKILEDVDNKAGIIRKTLVEAGLLNPKGIDLSDTDIEYIMTNMAKASKMSDGPEKVAIVQKVLDRITDKVPLGLLDWIDAYRYQNMLSSPQTQLKNIWTAIASVTVTRPLDLTAQAAMDTIGYFMLGKNRQVYWKDIPLHYVRSLNALPNGLIAFSDIMRGKVRDIQKPDIRQLKFKKLQRHKLGKALTVIPRFMEGTDIFSRNILAAAEHTRLVKDGVATSDAIARGNQMAEELLFRGKFKHDDTQVALVARAMDGLASAIVSMRKKVPPLGWFMPFVSMPMKFAKMNMEFSPLAFPATQPSREQISRAMLGTAVTGFGAVMALHNRTTWSAPTNAKEKQAFYAAGRKPYSVLINGKWVPMWYFGPFALSLAIPAAYKYNQEEYGIDNPLSSEQAQAIGVTTLDLGKFLMSQTPLTNFNAFFKMVEGDIDYKLPNQIAFTSSQIIPLTGMVRYVNKIVDPVYRDPNGFWETIKKDLPMFSKDLEIYRQPGGELSERDPTNLVLPWDLGTVTKEYEALYAARRKKGIIKKQMKKKKEKLIKEAKRKARLRSIK